MWLMLSRTRVLLVVALDGLGQGGAEDTVHRRTGGLHDRHVVAASGQGARGLAADEAEPFQLRCDPGRARARERVEHEAAGRFHEQDVADQPVGDETRVHGAAVEVVDLHVNASLNPAIASGSPLSSAGSTIWMGLLPSQPAAASLIRSKTNFLVPPRSEISMTVPGWCSVSR